MEEMLRLLPFSLKELKGLYVGKNVDWNQLTPFTTLGLDEIALRKWHKYFVCVVTALDATDQVIVLAILPDRLKQTVLDFLKSMPVKFRTAILRMCSDMYEGYINAAKEALPGVLLSLSGFMSPNIIMTVWNSCAKPPCGY